MDYEYNYTVGFLFSEDESKVALIRKTKPEWQAGKLNGIGGKIEKGETERECMRREFREEAGVDISTWELFIQLKNNHDSWIVHFFTAKADLGILRAMEEEDIEIVNVEDIQNLNVIPNLKWLIPMALDRALIIGSASERRTMKCQQEYQSRFS